MSNIKWQYADHWRTPSPQGPINQFASMREMDRFIKQIASVGLTGIGMFAWNLGAISAMFGSLRSYREFLADRGIEKIVDLFWCAPQASPGMELHNPEHAGRVVGMLEHFVRLADGLEVENLVVMPAHCYTDTQPVTAERIKVLADVWNRAGRMAAGHGLKLGCHHEFWCGIRSQEEIDLFYAHTDSDFVHLYIDTAQHVIAGVDPVALYEKYASRVNGFHFKDTRHVDLVEDYRSLPDPELVARTTPRWFYEMGTPGGMVDFPALMRALKRHAYQGWIGVEHDKADIGGGSYPESTALAMWYARNVLSPIYS
ncbi:sugar phosphate isomerase/epimerase family protein [Novosphingobium humi]|uniref:Sugar phosphate isomerase/epimerase n=1 Tax=Novosphingobium humi TaxID=2282397 RepID=A0ABY7U4K9_9SPHN|nr:sugar phosphate isomerase/epimerase family protein [Novosphingobium humi]WCT79751.1 sugar phosphate isomerase/epimerase [Novosphingobium humi]WJT00259.1 sugar phosphate isomerase/epimerase [Novosphingobium humi]